MSPSPSCAWFSRSIRGAKMGAAMRPLPCFIRYPFSVVRVIQSPPLSLRPTPISAAMAELLSPAPLPRPITSFRPARRSPSSTPASAGLGLSLWRKPCAAPPAVASGSAKGFGPSGSNIFGPLNSVSSTPPSSGSVNSPVNPVPDLSRQVLLSNHLKSRRSVSSSVCPILPRLVNSVSPVEPSTLVPTALNGSATASGGSTTRESSKLGSSP